MTSSDASKSPSASSLIAKFQSNIDQQASPQTSPVLDRSPRLPTLSPIEQAMQGRVAPDVAADDSPVKIGLVDASSIQQNEVKAAVDQANNETTTTQAVDENKGLGIEDKLEQTKLDDKASAPSTPAKPTPTKATPSKATPSQTTPSKTTPSKPTPASSTRGTPAIKKTPSKPASTTTTPVKSATRLTRSSAPSPATAAKSSNSTPASKPSTPTKSVPRSASKPQAAGSPASASSSPSRPLVNAKSPLRKTSFGPQETAASKSPAASPSKTSSPGSSRPTPGSRSLNSSLRSSTTTRPADPSSPGASSSLNKSTNRVPSGSSSSGSVFSRLTAPTVSSRAKAVEVPLRSNHHAQESVDSTTTTKTDGQPQRAPVPITMRAGGRALRIGRAGAGRVNWGRASSELKSEVPPPDNEPKQGEGAKADEQAKADLSAHQQANGTDA